MAKLVPNGTFTDITGDLLGAVPYPGYMQFHALRALGLARFERGVV